MPLIKSAIKRAKQQVRRREHNIAVKSAVKADVKTFIKSLGTPKAEESMRAAISEIDRAVKKGVLHANTAARRKSQLAKLIAAQTGDKPAVKAATKPSTKKKAAAKAVIKKTAAKAAKASAKK